MNITAPYQQINDYIAAKTKQPITISYVNDKEIKVSYTRKIFIKEVNLGIGIKIEKVGQSEVVLSYQAPLGLDMVIEGAISFLISKLPELASGINMADGNRIHLTLDKIEKAKPIIENISLRDITFSESAIVIDFSLKY